MTDRLQLRCCILQDVQILDVQLGEGAYGRVFEVKCAGVTYAAKEIHSVLFSSTNSEELARIKNKFLQECRIWSKLCHPKIVTFVGVFLRDGDHTGFPIMVMEKMQYSLRSLIEGQEDSGKRLHIDLRIKVSILHDVAKGLCYLHSDQDPPIIHRDLTPNNILLSHKFEAKISDLGVSKVMKNTGYDSEMTKAPGTPSFMPPETFDDNPKYDTAVDIFSYAGVTMYTITEQWPTPTSRERINPQNHKREIIPEVERRQDYLNKMTGSATKLKPLVQQCLDDEPRSRPKISHIIAAIGAFNKDISTCDKSQILLPAPSVSKHKSPHRQVSLYINSLPMGTSGLPDIYTQGLQAQGLRV